MYIADRGYNAITLMSMETKLMESREIFIDGEIDSEMACEFRKKLLLLNRQSRHDPITVYINSPGGEITQGLLMYDAIQGSPAPVRLVCTGQASSMAAILLASGSHGRLILPNSTVMIHEPLIRGGLGGKTSSIKSISDSLLETRRKLNGILARHTGHTVEEIDEATAYDHYFSAEEAVEYGLCDRVVTFDVLTKEV